MVVEKDDLTIRKVLVLYVGGTIGMEKNDKGVYVPSPNKLLEKLKYLSRMHDPEMAKKYFSHLENNQLVLPSSIMSQVVLYQINEYNPLLDSSDMGVKEWIRIAKDIGKYYNDFDGFVVLHGTDTLAFTAAMLSFMLRGLDKTLILTGSQIPIFETRSDAKDNILSSLILASFYTISEVSVFFANKLFRGNRTTKICTDLLNAFDSPDYHTLADVGININVHHHYIFHPDKDFSINTNLCPHVALLTIFPTMTTEMLKSFLMPPVEGLVLQTYGAGNMPCAPTDLLDAIADAVKRGVIVVNVTQCTKGAVSVSYAGGERLAKIGILSGHDMTVEGALTKLCYVLGLPIAHEEKIKLMKKDIRGEMTMKDK